MEQKIVQVRPNVLKVTYHAHVELDDIPKGIKQVLDNNLIVDTITYDSEVALWEIKYFEELRNL